MKKKTLYIILLVAALAIAATAVVLLIIGRQQQPITNPSGGNSADTTGIEEIINKVDKVVVYGDASTYEEANRIFEEAITEAEIKGEKDKAFSLVIEQAMYMTYNQQGYKVLENMGKIYNDNSSSARERYMAGIRMVDVYLVDGDMAATQALLLDMDKKIYNLLDDEYKEMLAIHLRDLGVDSPHKAPPMEEN